jgi:hypothetical protein
MRLKMMVSSWRIRAERMLSRVTLVDMSMLLVLAAGVGATTAWKAEHRGGVSSTVYTSLLLVAMQPLRTCTALGRARARRNRRCPAAAAWLLCGNSATHI